MKKQTSLVTLGLLLATPALAGGAGAPVAQPTPACMSIAQIVTSDPNFSTLATAVEAAGLTETLQGGSYTVFAPTNAAFAKLPSDTLAAVLNDADALRGILLYHVVPGKVTAKQVTGMTSGKTAQGSSFLVTISDGKVMIDNATVTKADVVACNGIVHVIDTVLMPAPASAEAPAMPETTEATVEVSAPVEAPVAEAAPAAPMASAPSAVDIASIPALPLSGATAMPPAADTTTTTDMTTSTDTVVTETAPVETTDAAPMDTATDTTETAPVETTTEVTETATVETTETATMDTTTEDTTAAADATGDTEMVEMNTNSLYDVIVADERFSSLRDLLSDAGITDILMDNDYTIFAPTNEAFAAVDPDTLALIASDPDTLQQVLLYHIVTGRVTGEQLAQDAQLSSLEGSSIDLKMEGGTQMVGPDGKVIATVDSADNGVIYVIDKVLLPPNLKLPAPPTPAEAPAATTDTSAAAAAPVAVAPAAPVSPTPAAVTGSMTLEQRLAEEPQFSTLLSLLQTADLVTPLMASDVTIFAPTNDAFAKVPKATLDRLMADKALLKQVLSFHVVFGRVSEADLQAAQLRSLEGSSLDLKTEAGVLSIGVLDGANIVGSTLNVTPIIVGNNAIYPIDSVLIPPTFQ